MRIDLSWWRHQMGPFSVLLALCAGNSPFPVNSPHNGQWRGALFFSLICVWINDWVNNREAGDLRCHRGHYDVNVMCDYFFPSWYRFDEHFAMFLWKFQWSNFYKILHMPRKLHVRNFVVILRSKKQSQQNGFFYLCFNYGEKLHYIDLIMGAVASQITSLTIVYSTVYSGADQRKHQSSASLAFVRGIHRWPVNSPHKWPVTRRKMFPFDDVIMRRWSGPWGVIPNVTKYILLQHLVAANRTIILHLGMVSWELD